MEFDTEKYRKLLPRDWDPTPYPTNKAWDYRMAMAAELTERHMVEEWLVNPWVTKVQGEIYSMWAPGWKPNDEEFKLAKGKLDARLNELHREARALWVNLSEGPLDPLTVLGLEPDSTAEMVYAAFTDLLSHYRLTGEWWRARLDEIDQSDAWAISEAHWQVQIAELSQQRIHTAHSQLAQSIGSKKPSWFYQLFARWF